MLETFPWHMSKVLHIFLIPIASQSNCGTTYLSPPAIFSAPMSGSTVDRFLLLPKAPIPKPGLRKGTNPMGFSLSVIPMASKLTNYLCKEKKV